MAGSRIAVLNPNKCKPNKCNQECKRSCPVVKTGKHCIEVTPSSKLASISEPLCIGCAICVKKCPFNAIQIVNLPKSLHPDHTVHRYGPNSFLLHRLPLPRPASILGLVGANGTGKTTVLKLLSGLKPNLGKFDKPPDWKEVLAYFRGSELQKYFTGWVEDKLKVVHKPQEVYSLKHTPQSESTVREFLSKKDERGVVEDVCSALELNCLLDRKVVNLSGGELQRFAIAYAAVQEAEVYIFDEPSNYLDIKQRLKAAGLVRTLGRRTGYVVVVEHDLSMLDYMSDQVCFTYGEPGAYGVVTAPYSAGEGINVFLDGYEPMENVRFREESLTFKTAEAPVEVDEEYVHAQYSYPEMSKTMDGFTLKVEAGKFKDSQIIVMLGENGTGKTTFVKMLAGKVKPDNEAELPLLSVSYKPQAVSFQSKVSTVRKALQKVIGAAVDDPVFKSDVMKPLRIESLMEHELSTLSGGEEQRVALCLCLGKEADVYLIDEPSANLDAEQRVLVSRVIKRFIYHSKKTAFVVEHDLLMASYLADMVIVYDGQPSVKCVAGAPQSPAEGIDLFLERLGVTFRRDMGNFRPRLNKPESARDRKQKAAGTYYDDSDPAEQGRRRRSSARSRRTTSS